MLRGRGVHGAGTKRLRGLWVRDMEERGAASYAKVCMRWEPHATSCKSYRMNAGLKLRRHF